MGKIKRGISLLLCCLLLGSILTAGSVTDVQASKQQTDTVTQQSIKNTDTTKKVSDDQTSDKAGQNEEKDTGEDAQTDTVESKETFFVLPVYREGTTAISTDRAAGIQQIQEVGFTDPNFAAAVYDSLLKADWMGEPGQSVKDVLGSFTGVIEADGYAREIVYIVTAQKVVFDPLTVTDISETFDTQAEAQAYYDSLVDIVGVEQYANKKITQGETTLDTQKPENELIKNIEGIEWLREAELIDLKNNRISDITPLSKANIRKAANKEGIKIEDIIDGKGWFGIADERNTRLNLAFNPIILMPEFGAGRLVLEGFDSSSKIETKGELVYINPVEENLKGKQYDISLPIPLVEKEMENSESRRAQLDEDSTVTIIDSSNTRGEVSVPYEETSKPLDKNVLYKVDTKGGTVLPVEGILSSGHIRCATATTSADGITVATFSKGDLKDQVPDTPYLYRFNFDQMIRIYSKIIPKVQLEITLEKTVADTDESRVRPVEGAKFELHKATKNSDGTFVPENKIENSYTTDENGKITVVGEFPPGDYCFVEVKAPKGFELNSKPIGFTVSAHTVAIGGGQPTVTPTDESGNPTQSVYAGDGSTFFDRYSPAVTVTVSADNADIKLKEIDISYYDWKKDGKSTKIYKNENNSASEIAGQAAGFINANKGDSNNIGNIDSTVIVQSVFEKTPVTTKNKRKTVNFEFVKKDSLSKEPMAGVEFSLTCNHKHDDECQYNGVDEASCMHSHNDKEGYIDSKGCTWSKTVKSDENGIVKFAELLSGEYELKEKATLDGFVLPGGTWILTVNTDPDEGEKEIQIEKKDKNDSTTPEFKENGELVVENEPKIPFSFIKVDEKTGNALAGAEFTLYQVDENDADKWSIVGEPVVSSEEGIVDFGRLKQGEYFLKETKSPKGYLKPTGYWKVTIAVTKEDNKKVTFEAKGDVPAISGDYKEGFKVSNRETSRLPKLGGKGTTLFWIGGLSVIGCALILCFKFKRKGA